MERVVVIGAGQAGFEVVRTLRSNAFVGSITVVGDEECIPYQRPPLSKAFLTGSGDAEDAITLRPHDFFTSHHIGLLCGNRAVSIDRDAATVDTADGTLLGYDHLILATGTRNRPLPVPGTEFAGVFQLRTLEDARMLRAELTSGAHVIVVGGGFIGLEVAAAAVHHGARVTIIEWLDRPMARAVSPTISAHFVDTHSDHGVEWRLGTAVESITGRDGRVTGVCTADGSVLTADVVVIGVGVVPNTELAADAGLEVDDGVVVDRHLLTADPRISAVGDCASYDPGGGAPRRRLESVQNAVDQARCVADRLTGSSAPFDAVPWFWSKQYASKLQIAGLAEGHDNEVVRGSIADGRFSVFRFLDEQLIAVESVNRVRDHVAARSILATDARPTAEQVADPDFDPGALVAGRGVER